VELIVIFPPSLACTPDMIVVTVDNPYSFGAVGTAGAGFLATGFFLAGLRFGAAFFGAGTRGASVFSATTGSGSCLADSGMA
jgi:hypothetical protein